ncbi:MAG: hypothetical protein AAB365_03345 [Patescibacteria group bacterium]
MRQFTSEQLKEQFERLSPELQAAVTSPEIHDKIMAVGKKHGLLIDQLGELVDEIGLILLGLVRSSDFVSHATERLGIPSKVAQALATDVNHEIFDSIRDYLRKSEVELSSQRDEAEQDHSAAVENIERVGGFDIEQETPKQNFGKEVTSADRDQILDNLENPRTTPSTKSAAFENHTEPLVDRLLSNPAGMTEEKVAAQSPIHTGQVPPNLPTEAPKQTPTPPVAPKKQGNDPYRELIK